MAAAIVLWSLWLLCILLIVPVLINVPGKATDAELSLYLATLVAVTGYPILLPVLTAGARRARPSSAKALRILTWAAFCGVLAVFATVGLLVYAQERAKPVPTQTEIFEGSYANAILWHDTGWMDRLMAEGASVDQVLPPFGQTPAVMSADFGDWTLVLFLLGRGADPDRKDDKGQSVRTLAASPHTAPKKEAEVKALGQVRAFLSRGQADGSSRASHGRP